MSATSDYLKEFDAIDLSAKLATSANEADYKLAGAEAQRSYADQVGDVDAWASEMGFNLSKSAASAAQAATGKQYAALTNLGRRETGGGSFSKSLGGRNRINLGSVSGGLEAANNARLKSELNKVAATKKTNLAGDLAANTAYAQAARDAAAAKTAADVEAKRAANKLDPDKILADWQSEISRKYQNSQRDRDAQMELYGEATGVGNQRRRRSKVTGQTELSDYYGHFAT